MRLYDRFKDEYVEEEDVDLTAPPERYVKVDSDLIINNGVRWLVEAMRGDDNG